MWVRLAWYIPISWSDFLALPASVRQHMFLALNDLRREMEGSNGGVTGQARGDRKLGFD